MQTQLLRCTQCRFSPCYFRTPGSPESPWICGALLLEFFQAVIAFALSLGRTWTQTIGVIGAWRWPETSFCSEKLRKTIKTSLSLKMVWTAEGTIYVRHLDSPKHIFVFSCGSKYGFDDSPQNVTVLKYLRMCCNTWKELLCCAQ